MGVDDSLALRDISLGFIAGTATEAEELDASGVE